MPAILQSAADWSLKAHRYEPSDLYPRLKAAGYGAVEMADEARWPEVRAAGLKLLNIGTPGMTDGLNRRENHATLLPQIRALIDKAQANSIPQLIVFSGSKGGLTDEQGIAGCVEALASLEAQARQAGVVLLLEVLNRFDHADYHADRGGFAFEVIRRVESPSVRVLYDLYHAHRSGDDPLAVAAANLPLIGHLHTAGSPKRDFPGPDQAIDYRSLVRNLTATGYSGHWGHEFLAGDDALPQYLQAAALFASYADAAIR